MNTKHTPGPWKIEERVIVSVTGQNVSGCVVSRMTPADARLIAAAPELLEACKFFMACLDDTILVRNTDNDASDDFTVRMLDFTMKLKKAHDAIQKAATP